MNVPDDIQQFQLKVQEIRESRNSRDTKDVVLQTDKKRRKRIDHVLQPILEAFVNSDQALQIQSRGSMGFFIAYGLSQVCRIEVNVTSDELVELRFQSDSNTSLVYSGPMNDAEIRKATEYALLAWYKEVV